MLWSQKIDVVDMDSKKRWMSAAVWSLLGDTVCTNSVDFGVGLDVGGTKARKNVRQKLAFEVESKNGTKRVAVRALNFSTRPFCMKFRGGSNRDGPEGQNPQKYNKNVKKTVTSKKWLKVKHRVDVKKKNCRFWVSPGRFSHHQILKIAINFRANPAVKV